MNHAADNPAIIDAKRAALILDRVGKGSCETHGKRPRIRSKLVVGFRAGLHVFDGDFDDEFSATDILLGPSDLCSHVILVERRHFDVHAFYHGRSPPMSGAMPRCTCDPRQIAASRPPAAFPFWVLSMTDLVTALTIDADGSGNAVFAECQSSRRWRRPSQAIYLSIYPARVFSARSASVSHLSAISIKNDLCSEVRADSANRMHSAALSRNWTKLSKCASISVHMGTDRALCPRMILDPSAEEARPHSEQVSVMSTLHRLSSQNQCPTILRRTSARPSGSDEQDRICWNRHSKKMWLPRTGS